MKLTNSLVAKNSAGKNAACKMVNRLGEGPGPYDGDVCEAVVRVSSAFSRKMGLSRKFGSTIIGDIIEYKKITIICLNLQQIDSKSNKSNLEFGAGRAKQGIRDPINCDFHSRTSKKH